MRHIAARIRAGEGDRVDPAVPTARALYQESLRLRWELGYRQALAQSLEDLAELAGREEQAVRLARLLGAAEALCEALGARSPIALGVAAYQRTIARGRAALGEAEFTAAWAEGWALSLEGPVEYARTAEPVRGA